MRYYEFKLNKSKQLTAQNATNIPHTVPILIDPKSYEGEKY